jgi:RNA polymerase sigma factor (TIGR02999 family)
MLTDNAAPAVTDLLRAVEAGSPDARDRLNAAVDAEMRRVARHIPPAGRGRRTVSPTELVHGAALTLMVQQKLSARDRANFVAWSAPVMRRVLAEHTRRGPPTEAGGAGRVTLVSTLAEEAKEELDFDALDAALEKLATLSSEQARLAELRYFGGMTIEEIAELDGAPAATVKRNWHATRDWLHHALAACAASPP